MGTTKKAKKILTSILVDHSGSMASCLSDAQGGYDTFIKERQNEGAKEYVSLTEFDTSFDLVYDYTKVSDVPSYRIIPAGATAFNDALAFAIHKVDKRPEAQNKNVEKVFVIITDGYENSSREYGGEDGKQKVRKLVEDRQGKGWVFIFLGADMDAVQTAGAYGISTGTTMSYDSKLSGVATASASNMMTRGVAGQGFIFSSAERTASAGTSTPNLVNFDNAASNSLPLNTVPTIIDWDDEQE